MRDEAEWRVFLAKVHELRLPTGDYAVFGSGPMFACGLIEMGACDRFVRLGGNVEIFGGWMGMDVDGIIGRAVFVEGIPFARLEDVLAFKRSLGRAKDIEHTRLIEKYLAKE